MSTSCPERDVCGMGWNTNLLNEYSLWPIQSKSHVGLIWGLVQPTYTILFIVFRRGQANDEESLLTSPPLTSLWIWVIQCWGACTVSCLIFTQKAKPSLAFIWYLLLQLLLLLLFYIYYYSYYCIYYSLVPFCCWHSLRVGILAPSFCWSVVNEGYSRWAEPSSLCRNDMLDSAYENPGTCWTMGGGRGESLQTTL